MTIPYLLAIACVLTSLVVAILRSFDHYRWGLAAKCVASTLFCLTAVAAMGQRSLPANGAAMRILIGLALGLVGDVFLGLAPLVSKKMNLVCSGLGGAAFFTGHIFYIRALLMGVPMRWPLLVLLPVVPLLFLVLYKTRIFNPGKRIIPIFGYGVVLGAMMVAALNYALNMVGGPLGNLPIALLMWVPGVLFAISDTSLFLRTFATEKIERFPVPLDFAVMLPYFSAQAIFALLVAYI